MLSRSVGYCYTEGCVDYLKGVFLLNHGGPFYCCRCRQQGEVAPEKGRYTGNSSLFREVRVEFDYSPLLRRYQSTGIVREESLLTRNGNTYTLTSPLIKTERRALKVAESILCNLNRYRDPIGPDGILHYNEIILSFDDDREKFATQVKQVFDSMAAHEKAMSEQASQ